MILPPPKDSLELGERIATFWATYCQSSRPRLCAARPPELTLARCPLADVDRWGSIVMGWVRPLTSAIATVRRLLLMRVAFPLALPQAPTLSDVEIEIPFARPLADFEMVRRRLLGLERFFRR